MPEAAADPLHRFPVFGTSDPEELRYLATTLFGAASIDLKNTNGFEARVNLVQLEETALAFGATTADLVIDNLAADFIRLQIAHRGRATSSADGRTTDVNARQFATFRPKLPRARSARAGHERLTLRLNGPALSRRLAALLGARPKGEPTSSPPSKRISRTRNAFRT